MVTPARWLSSRLTRGIRARALDTVRADRWKLAIAVLALAAVVGTNQFDLATRHLSNHMLNANLQLSWSHLADTLVIAAGVLATVIGARVQRDRRRLWIAAGTILALFFLDEASPLHDHIDKLPGGKLLYTPILLALVVCVWYLANRSDEQRIIGLGLATLFFSFGMHIVGLRILIPLGYFNWLYQAGVGVKTGTELAGLLLVVLGIWRLARAAPRSI